MFVNPYTLSARGGLLERIAAQKQAEAAGAPLPESRDVAPSVFVNQRIGYEPSSIPGEPGEPFFITERSTVDPQDAPRDFVGPVYTGPAVAPPAPSVAAVYVADVPVYVAPTPAAPAPAPAPAPISSGGTVIVSTPSGPVYVAPQPPAQGAGVIAPYGTDSRGYAQSIAPIEDAPAGSVSIVGTKSEGAESPALSGRALLSIGLIALSLLNR